MNPSSSTNKVEQIWLSIEWTVTNIHHFQSTKCCKIFKVWPFWDIMQQRFKIKTNVKLERYSWILYSGLPFSCFIKKSRWFVNWCIVIQQKTCIADTMQYHRFIILALEKVKQLVEIKENWILLFKIVVFSYSIYISHVEIY